MRDLEIVIDTLPMTLSPVSGALTPGVTSAAATAGTMGTRMDSSFAARSSLEFRDTAGINPIISRDTTSRAA